MKKYKKILKITDIYSIESLKMAYRNAVKENHPDRFKKTTNKELATRKMKLINEAYEYLKQHLNDQEVFNEEKIEKHEDSNEKYHKDDIFDEEYDYEIKIPNKILFCLIIMLMIIFCCSVVLLLFCRDILEPFSQEWWNGLIFASTILSTSYLLFYELVPFLFNKIKKIIKSKRPV